jgi:hypothetical protein
MARLAAIAIERGSSHIDFQVLDWSPARNFYHHIGMSHLGECGEPAQLTSTSYHSTGTL